MSKWTLFRHAVLAFAVVGVAGAGATAPLKILGFNDMSCRSWSASINDSEQRQLFVAWIRGFLTGHNYANQGQQVAAISSASVEQYINRYCAEKPLSQISEAAFRLSDQLSGRNAAITK